jgi:hypothetical protein
MADFAFSKVMSAIEKRRGTGEFSLPPINTPEWPGRWELWKGRKR